MPSPSPLPLPGASSTSLLLTPHKLCPLQVLPTLKTVHTSQDVLDEEWDNEDLWEPMRTVLCAGSNLEILSVLQIEREEMPEVIKTLQRALKWVGDAGTGAEKGMDMEK